MHATIDIMKTSSRTADFPEKYFKILERLGLTKTQTSLYLTSLKHGTLSVLELSKFTGVNRQQIYEDAEKLVSLGLYDITNKKRRKYIPATPAALVRLGEERVKEAQATSGNISNLVPHLESITKNKQRDVDFKYFEGVKKIQQAYEEELRLSKNTEVLVFAGAVDTIFEFFPESYWAKWNEQFVNQKSHSRMLIHKSETARETSQFDADYNRETRWLDPFPLQASIDVFNDVVLVVSYKDETAVWIENPVIADSYRIMFNSLWKFAKPFE